MADTTVTLFFRDDNQIAPQKDLIKIGYFKEEFERDPYTIRHINCFKYEFTKLMAFMNGEIKLELDDAKLLNMFQVDPNLYHFCDGYLSLMANNGK